MYLMRKVNFLLWCKVSLDSCYWLAHKSKANLKYLVNTLLTIFGGRLFTEFPNKKRVLYVSLRIIQSLTKRTYFKLAFQSTINLYTSNDNRKRKLVLKFCKHRKEFQSRARTEILHLHWVGRIASVTKGRIPIMILPFIQ